MFLAVLQDSLSTSLPFNVSLLIVTLSCDFPLYQTKRVMGGGGTPIEISLALLYYSASFLISQMEVSGFIIPFPLRDMM